MRALVVVSLGLSACLSPNLVPCGDTLCPPDTVCLPDVERCVTQNALDACGALADGAECTVDDTIGVCQDRVCTTARCGDGLIEPGEDCEGGIPSGADCGYFGYYRGELTCGNTCRFDATACTGRCGDGTLDIAKGEYCDGVLPTGATCFDFGYGVGNLECGKACGADVSDCHQLGWERVQNIHEPIANLWGGDGWIAYVTDAGAASVIADGPIVTAPGTGYAAVAGSPTGVWAAGAAALATWTPLGGWITATPPWAADQQVKDVWASDSLGVYVSISTSADLWHFDGASWTTVSGTWGAGPTFGSPEDILYVIDSSDVATWDGTTWGSLGIVAATVVKGGDGVLYALQRDTTIDSWPGGVLQQTSWPFFAELVQIAASPTGIVGGGLAFEQNGESSHFFFVGAAPYAGSWILNPRQLASDGRGMILTGSSTGLFAISRGVWDNVTGRGGTFGFHAAIAFDSAGTATTAVPNASSYTLDAWDTWQSFGRCDLAEVAGTTQYCTSGSGLTITTPDSSTTVDGGSIAALWVSKDGSIAATAGAQSFARGDAASWETSTPPIAFTELRGDSIDDLYAIGTETGATAAQLWHYDGAIWTAVTPISLGAPAHLVVGSAMVSAVVAQQLLRFDRATGTSSTIDVGFSLGLLTGVGTELFGTNTDTVAASRLWFFDDSRWSPVRMPDSSDGHTINAIADSGHELDVSLDQGPRISETIIRLVRTGSWH
ncbi:MAG TPA: hypothetical protein VGM90_06440 [Kofleriaceae bacterium]|jgi:hypothetical protein